MAAGLNASGGVRISKLKKNCRLSLKNHGNQMTMRFILSCHHQKNAVSSSFGWISINQQVCREERETESKAKCRQIMFATGNVLQINKNQ